jgi:hypothetical protein
MEQKPLLIEPGVKYFINSTLKECRKFKDKNLSIIFNISMILFLVVLIGSFLVYRYKGKLTPSELELKNRKTHEYIVSKLHHLALYKKQQYQSQNMITGLPTWSDHPEINILSKVDEVQPYMHNDL